MELVDRTGVDVATAAIDRTNTAAGPHTRRAGRAAEFACRTLDVIVAVALLLVLSPLLLLVAIAIRLDSPGPILFRQRRVGRDLQSFTVNKFRSMYDGASNTVHRQFVLKLIAGEKPQAADSGPRFKLAADTRVTRVGRFLRRSSLDELPQLWNVVRGDMSLVGPRPSISYEVEHYPPHWFERFTVKPGITGLWQVSGRGELSVPEMIELDAEYVRRRSLWLNVWILIRTVPAVLSSRGAS
jgi:lipopolysaccharide/colanic/teichoic acid biosynthesis glycosyltransferase